MPVWKRALDFGFIICTAPCWGAVMLTIAVGIKLASPGPVFFRQERVGYRGRRFICLKFRSMRCDSNETPHKEHLSKLMKSGQPMVKLDTSNDPRVIPCGDILRASGLDELPQLFNVLQGDMSLVGPRPCTTYEYEGYEPWQTERFAAYPGLTGLWQVTGKNKTTFDEMIGLDIQYGQNLSWKSDLRIIAKTFGVLLRQMGAALARRNGESDAPFITQVRDYERAD